MRIIKTIIVILVVCVAAGALTSCGKKNSGEVVAEEDNTVTNSGTDETYSGKDIDENSEDRDGNEGSDKNSDDKEGDSNSADSNNDNGDAGVNKDKADMKALAEECIAADSSLPAMLTIDSDAADASRQFAYISNVDYDLVDSFFLAYSEAGLADEIAVIKMKDSADAKTMKKSLEEHIDDRIKLFTSYQADQVERVEKNSCYKNGEYVVLIICDGKNKVRKVIDNYINQ